MASTWSDLKFQLMATGENLSTWGSNTNLNIGTAIQESIVGSADVTFASGTVTLTLTDTALTQTARNMRLNLTGTSGGAQNLVVPAIEKIYVVHNGCADTITVKNSTGTGIAVPAGKTMWVYNNGTNVVDVVTHLTTLSVGSAATLGTQQTTQGSLVLANTAAGAFPVTVQSSNSTSAAWTFTYPTTAGTNGYVLTTNGSGVTSWAAQTASGVSSLAGTANQITASSSTGAVTLSLPSAVTLPGTLAVTGTAVAPTFYSTLNASVACTAATPATIESVPAGSAYKIVVQHNTASEGATAEICRAWASGSPVIVVQGGQGCTFTVSGSDIRATFNTTGTFSWRKQNIL